MSVPGKAQTIQEPSESRENSLPTDMCGGDDDTGWKESLDPWITRWRRAFATSHEALSEQNINFCDVRPLRFQVSSTVAASINNPNKDDFNIHWTNYTCMRNKRARKYTVNCKWQGCGGIWERVEDYEEVVTLLATVWKETEFERQATAVQDHIPPGSAYPSVISPPQSCASILEQKPRMTFTPV